MERVFRHFQEDLDTLKQRLLTQGGLAEERVREAIRALMERDAAGMDAVLAGASEAAESILLRSVPALEATPEDVLDADGLLIGTPENFGYMSGALKYFFDRCYYPCLERTQGRPYGVFIRAGKPGDAIVFSWFALNLSEARWGESSRIGRAVAVQVAPRSQEVETNCGNLCPT